MATNPRPSDRLSTPESWGRIGWLNSGMLYLSQSLEVTLYNDLAAELLNIVAPIGQPLTLEHCLTPDREEYQVLVSLVRIGKECKNQIVTWSADGRIRHVLVDSFRRENAQGHLEGLHVVMKDLGDFAILEQQMQKSDKLATVGKIAAGIAHEIRNPLTTLKGFLQVLEHRFEKENRAEEQEFADVMLREIERVNALVSELLLLSKPHKIHKSTCSLATLMSELQPLLQSEALLANMKLVLDVGEVPDIEGDAPLLKQMVMNLAKNAMEAMESGGTLKITVQYQGGCIEMDVSDTGPGIPYYLIDKIFDAFYTTKDKGTGLGLPICQRIVNDHGGEIRVSSKGFGTTFHVRLPIGTENNLLTH